MQQNESRHRFYILHNSKWITELNVKCKTVELLEDNIRENSDDLRYGNDILDTTLNA